MITKCAKRKYGTMSVRHNAMSMGSGFSATAVVVGGTSGLEVDTVFSVSVVLEWM